MQKSPKDEYLYCGISNNCKLRVKFVKKETNTIQFEFTSGDNQDLWQTIIIHGMDKNTVTSLQSQLEHIKQKLTC